MRGASMALHSMLGFGAGFVAPLAFGAVLDAGGGNAEPDRMGAGLCQPGRAGRARAPDSAAAVNPVGRTRMAGALERRGL